MNQRTPIVGGVLVALIIGMLLPGCASKGLPPQGELPGPVNLENNSGLLGRDQPGLVVLGANDLGMHCADQDDRIFSVLPPFNVLHAQVIQRGGTPQILSDADVNVVMTGGGEVVEVQATAEGALFSRAELDRLLDMAAAGIERLDRAQRQAAAA